MGCAWWVAMAVLAIAGSMSPAGAQPHSTAFPPRYTNTIEGGIALIGNSLLTCSPTDPAQPACASARAEGLNGTSDNNGRNMIYIDIDGNPSTFNSSNAALQLNPGSIVHFAALVWGGFKDPPPSGTDPRASALFQTPGSGGYTTVTGQILGSLQFSTSYPSASYVTFADVTSLVAAGGNGTYTVANVQALTGVTSGGLSAGWSLIVVYEDDTQPLRNLTVFAGFVTIASGNGPQSATAAGFVTPPTGGTTAQIGVVALEGDRGITGDQMLLNNTALSDALNPASNFFNSSITNLGSYVTAKSPNYTNQFGWDIKNVQSNNVLPNNATSALVTVNTNGDSYQVAILTTAIDVFAPVLVSAKSVTNVTHPSGLLMPGDVLQYSVKVSSIGVDTATKTVLTDRIPANTTYVPGSLIVTAGANTGPKTDTIGDDLAEFDPAANAVIFRLGSGATPTVGGQLPKGASTTIQFQVQAAPALPFGTTITNVSSTSAIGQTSLQPVASSSQATSLTVNATPDLTIIKTNAGQFVQGSSGTYMLTVQNLGPTATSGTVTVTDVLPPSLTPTAASGGGWNCGISGQTVSCTTTSSLAVLSSSSITIGVSIAPNAPASVTNTATVSGGGDNSSGNNSADDTVAITAGPDLTITKTHSGMIYQGQQGVTFTFVVTNVGGAAAVGADVVSDTALPSFFSATGLGGAGWTCTPATLSCTRTDPLPPGASYPPITVTVDVAHNAPVSSGVNVVTVSGQGDVNPGNNTATDPVTILAGPDLAITKTHTGSFSQGQIGATYTITVTNTGGVPTTAPVVVNDTLPPGLTATSISGTGWTCTLGPLQCSRPDVLVPGASYPPITITVNVSPTAPATLTNIATVSSGGDVNSANDTTSDGAGIMVGPDLTITKTHPGSFSQGQNGATFIITVSNNGGTSTAGLVTVTDLLPAGLTGVSASGPGWTCPTAASCNRSDSLSPGVSYPPITLTVNVSPTAGTPLINSASVAGGGDINTGNNTATDSANVRTGTDLTITKTHSGNFSQGQTGATYTIVVANIGQNPTSGTVTVTDTLPAGLTGVSASGSGWTCATATTCSRSDALNGGASYPPITVVVNVAPNAPSSVVNSVSVSGGGDIFTDNDVASDPTTIFLGPDLTVTKTHSGKFIQGQSGFQYTIVVTNVGGTATSGVVTITDTLPAGFTGTSASGSGWTCPTPTSCNRSDSLAPGASYPPITLTVSVGVIGDNFLTVVNSVSVAGGGDVNDGNNSASDSTIVLQGTDLTIVKTHASNFTQGQTGASYAIEVSNAGGAATSGVVSVTDTLPTGLTATAISGSGWTCTLSSLTCTRNDSLASGASYPPITLTVNVAPNAPAQVTNSAGVSGGGDTNATNNSASDPTVVVGGADLTVTKSHTGNFTQGQKAVTYTIVVTNSGGGPSNGTVAVIDNLPTGLTATAISGTGWTCALGAVSCGRTDVLAPGASYPPITLTVDVASNAPSSVANTVSVSGGGDVNTGNDSATDNTSISAVPILKISKAATGVFTYGPNGGTYDLVVTNAGSAPTSGVVNVTDTLPPGLTIASVNGRGSWTCISMTATLACTRSDPLAAGASYPPITLVVNIALNAPAQITNTATVSGGGASGSSSGSSVTTIGGNPSTPLKCVVSAVPAPVRAEGLAELTGDILVTCTGGNPTSGGEFIPLSNIQLSLNTNITSRILNGLSEVVMIVNEAYPQSPNPGGVPPASGAGQPQLLCPASGGTGCDIVGSAGVGVYSGQPGHYNVFQGVPIQSPSQAGAWAVGFLGVPLDAPGANGVLTLRFTNIRANASVLHYSALLLTGVVASLSINGFQQAAIDNPNPIVGWVLPGLQTSIQSVKQLQCQQPASGLSVTFAEGFGSAFKARTMASSLAGDGNAIAPQNVPGFAYSSTESGFFSPDIAGTAGLADHGTRLLVRLTNVPQGVTLTLPLTTYLWPSNAAPPDPTNPVPPTGFPTPTGQLRLVATDSSGNSASGASYATSGEVMLNGGSGSAVYEVVSSSDYVVETTGAIPMTLTYSMDFPATLPATGQASVALSFGPLSAAASPDSTSPIPRFTTRAGAQTAFSVTPCLCNILFPYVTNQEGFDTGIAISNTTLDPFGTAAQQGSVSLYYFGSSVGGTVPGKQVSEVIPSGGQLVFTLSGGGNFGIQPVPGFSGYIIAQSSFQYCHGVANLGSSSRPREIYLGLVLDSPGLFRTGQSGESQSH